MTQHCASLTHFAFGADLITQSDSIKYFIFNGTIAYIQSQFKLADGFIII